MEENNTVKDAEQTRTREIQEDTVQNTCRIHICMAWEKISQVADTDEVLESSRKSENLQIKIKSFPEASKIIDQYELIVEAEELKNPEAAAQVLYMNQFIRLKIYRRRFLKYLKINF